MVVFASTQDEREALLYDDSLPCVIHRWPRRVMLPTPATQREMARLIREHNVDTVWFGAAAPLALMAPAARRAGAQRIIASTHGHEVGWSMIPGARHALRAIGNHADVITYVSEYARGRFQRAFGDHPEFVALPSGVDTEFFRPATTAQRQATRARLGVGDAPLIVCVSRLVARKGQDQLIRALPLIKKNVPDATLVIVGEGSYRSRLERLVTQLDSRYHESVVFTGRVDATLMRDIYAAADVAAIPVRTRGGGLDVEGLGIVFLEAQACGVPVVAGNSGGAPEAVGPNSGLVVDGRSIDEVASTITQVLIDDSLRASMASNGPAFVARDFSWDVLGARLAGLL
ncbi:GDP-mannose-dependent alpha-(1-6)-phosphatidylinositol monomannoside mannosyltransferase [Corynebacterium aquatimens]|uniref:Phosphatidylinositol alpha-1,6-mannosyltransferase n=1 Tax=Corynebacterium aquatimens TaxID=1190508 RepID=A0A931DZL6_9CORY|nr:phosphatidylinositol alpha-1,6-mannosyltransferase [Corynebacterium aquatimens]WJY65477.1 GDP-mannose-dependent alpha-(1-6)-phosphatidylinositol monomannoside mannosyltransferase [Corynebacterium aquatimens]